MDTAPPFDHALLAAWLPMCSDAGIMRNAHYHSATMRRRLVVAAGAGDGDPCSRVVAQFNPWHIATKRPPSTGMPAATASMSAVGVTRPFNPAAFNFNKAAAGEVVMTTPEGSLFINVNPLLLGHCLFVPDPPACHPQVLTPALLSRGLHLIHRAGRPDFRLGFNSLGAWASVNHFHMHAFYVGDVFDDGMMPLEHAALAVRASNTVVDFATTTDWPIPSLVITAAAHTPTALPSTPTPAPSCDEDGGAGAVVLPRALSAVAEVAGAVVTCLIADGIAHTVLVCQGGRRVYVMPRKHQGAEGGGAVAGELAAALAEMCGVAVVYSTAQCEGLTVKDYRRTMAASALDVEEWDRVTAACMDLMATVNRESG